jgi:hydroxyethylthiazole kinase
MILNFKKTDKSALVHCITNYVTANDVANILISSGNSPIMADALEEVEEIVSLSDSLVLNIGTLNSRVKDSMLSAGKTANFLNKPVVLDPVGIGASDYRSKSCFELLKEISFSVIRGNSTEIKAIHKNTKSIGGVDIDKEDEISESTLKEIVKTAKAVSRVYDSVVVVTGAMDIVTNGDKTYIVKNGHKNMQKISGTGCMLSALIGAFAGANSESVLESSAYAVCLMGLCGELAANKMLKEDLGYSSMKVLLLDYMSKLKKDELEGKFKIETFE